MSNIIHLDIPSRHTTREARLAVLLEGFARHRRSQDDVFWLKENAELLNILEVTGTPIGAEALAPLAEFYANVEASLAFFPQYYRFILSMTIDLETLGIEGEKAERLCERAQAQQLPEAELSDLQRMEARRLLARRGVRALPADAGLEDRLRAFMARSETFAIPNKKAAYELTHAVFYLSDYGRRDPDLDAQARRSLHYAGLIAFLDGNADLLAEIAIALKYSGCITTQPWEECLAQALDAFRITGGEDVPVQDHYHEYFVANWQAATAGGACFAAPIAEGRLRFDRGRRPGSALCELFECLLLLGANRYRGDALRDHFADYLGEEARQTFDTAARAVPEAFEDFFALFACTDGPGPRAVMG